QRAAGRGEDDEICACRADEDELALHGGPQALQLEPAVVAPRLEQAARLGEQLGQRHPTDGSNAGEAEHDRPLAAVRRRQLAGSPRSTVGPCQTQVELPQLETE